MPKLIYLLPASFDPEPHHAFLDCSRQASPQSSSLLINNQPSTINLLLNDRSDLQAPFLSCHTVPELPDRPNLPPVEPLMTVRVSQQPPQPLLSTATSSLVTPSQSSSYSMHRDSPTSSIRDDASSTSSLSLAADGRQRKRVYKNPETATTTIPQTSSHRELRSPVKQRKPSGMREQKNPYLARSAASPTKSSSHFRNASTSHSTIPSSNRVAGHDQASAQSPHTDNVTTFYAFSDNAKRTPLEEDDPFEFQPSVNLEDIHRGIIDTEQLEALSSSRRKFTSEDGPNTAASGLVRPQQRSAHAGTLVQPGSMLRRPSVSKYGGIRPAANRDQSMQKRQSTAPATLHNAASSSSLRKPMTAAEPESLASSARRPSMATVGSLDAPSPRKVYYAEGGYSRPANDGGVRIPMSARSAKSKSLQPPPRQTQNNIGGLSLTPEHFRASVAYPPKSPKSPNVQPGKNGTPSSTSSRRISTIPHASGLAARTISPTDARRLKRLSMINTPPPPSMPANYDSGMSAPASPALRPAKSATPSSVATTPEPLTQRKSYCSGLSLSSSGTSVRTSVASLQPKLALNLGNSRLPRPPQMDRDDEEIPPVPPLPKNISSPLESSSAEGSQFPSYENTPINTVKSANSGLYGPRKSSLAGLDRNEPAGSSQPNEFDDLCEQSSIGRAKSSNSNIFAPPKSIPDGRPPKTPENSQPQETFDLESFDLKLEQGDPKVLPHTMKLETPKTDRETRRKRGMTMGTPNYGGYHNLETKNSVSSLRKKDLAPIRLPPLNLLPLSTPTIARVNALGPASDSEELTPPRKYSNRTPGTPMTASKASFFGRHEREDPQGQERSRSSVNPSAPSNDSPSSLSLRAGSSASSGIPVSTSSRLGRQTVSPYVGSVPKSSGTGAVENPERRTILGMPMQGPREKSASRRSQDQPKTIAPPLEDPIEPPPVAGTSIRRKLSLTWKKTSQGKNSHAATERAEGYSLNQAPKYDAMPPPKLPASATWTAGSNSTPSPVKGKPFISQHARRQSSTTILLGQHDRTRSDSWGRTGSPKKEKKEEKAPPPPAKSSTANSILSPMHKMLGTKGSLSQLRTRNYPPASGDPSLDQDDLVAEEEMRKMASKRKGIEAQAVQLDELKRRATPKERCSPHHVLRTGVLNIFEKGEIVDYKDVYFTGLPDAKKHVGDLKNSTAPNFGYDDDRGDYSIIKGDHLAYRYEVIDILGKGSFGQVVRCIDHRTGGLVAIKIIRNKKRFHQQALVEVNILQKLKEWDPNQKHSLINFTQSFYFRGHLCISTELLGMNLYEFIKSNDFRGFSLKLIRRFTKQMLSSLILLKGHRVIHCDLKPENILLAHPAHTEIKVIDFGSSCFENEKVYTYIQSRFYRSPEVILGMSYGLPIDMWSLGCILAELKTGYPIFPGENEQEQLACIMEVFGPPEKHLIEKSTRRKLFFDSQGKPRMIVSSKGRRRRPSSKTLQNALKCDDEAFLDFVSRCLRWDPEKRLRPEEAMQHEFITGRKATRTRSSNYLSGTAASDNKERRYTAYSRPLPEPPAQKKSFGGSNSPLKAAPPSSTTTTTNTTNHAVAATTSTGASNTGSFRKGTTSKRNSVGAILGGSALPRAAAATGQRTASSKYPATSSTTVANTIHNTGTSTKSNSRMSTHRTAGAGTAGSLRNDAGAASDKESRRR